MKLLFGCSSTGAYADRRGEFKEFFSRKISGPEEGIPEHNEFRDSRTLLFLYGILEKRPSKTIRESIRLVQ